MQSTIAMQEADVIVFLVDVAGITSEDKELAKFFRNYVTKPVIVVVNKGDKMGSRTEEYLKEYERLGLGAPHLLSAIHGEGVGDILDKVVEALPSVLSLHINISINSFQKPESEEKEEEEKEQVSSIALYLFSNNIKARRKTGTWTARVYSHCNCRTT